MFGDSQCNRSEVLTINKPYDAVARATFVAGRSRLQDVKYGGIQGFDDQGKTTLPSLSDGGRYEFFILQPPTAVVLFVGSSGGAVSVPVTNRRPGSGSGSIPVIRLDTVLGSVTGAMVFPANDLTDRAFRKAPSTDFQAKISMAGRPNIDRMRWARPEDIHVISR